MRQIALLPVSTGASDTVTLARGVIDPVIRLEA
jgi:hypothetical protein